MYNFLKSEYKIKKKEKIDINLCVSWLGFSFSPCNGWHPFRAQAEEFLVKPDINYKSSILKIFYDRFQPSTLLEAHSLQHLNLNINNILNEKANKYIHYYPWLKIEKKSKNDELQHFGPTPTRGEKHFLKIKSILDSIKIYGYKPLLFRSDPISGYFLEYHGEKRFLVRSGLHRLGVLSALRKRMIKTKIIDPGNVDLKTYNNWPFVQQGKINGELALQIAKIYFLHNGMERHPFLIK
jgi:hypothetical protein